jgi:hypothetical protein
MQRIVSHWREWLARYGWAEVWGVITSYLGYFAGIHLTGSAVVGAFSASMGENVGYYGCIIWREIAGRRRSGAGISVTMLNSVGRDLLYEFGLPELLDSFIVRPSATYLAVATLGPTLGIGIGKLASDIVFYVLAVSLYERRKAKAGQL